MKQSDIFQVYKNKGELYTENLVPGYTSYGEELVTDGGVEYRTWDPHRSKLAAYIRKGVKNIGIRKGNIVLYLGASTGTTPSHVSDIVGEEGFVFALDSAPRVVRVLVRLCEARQNMAPILANAGNPKSYAGRVCSIDTIYQDIAQPSQARIFLDNCHQFLRPGGFGLLALKAKSIDIAKKPRAIYKDVKQQLEREMTLVDMRELDPYQKDHCMFLCKKK